MHVVIFVDFHDSSVGGVQTSVRGQRKGLEALGHTVTIVSPPPASGVDTDPNVITLPALPLVRPNGFPLAIPSPSARRLIEKALSERPAADIFHVQTNIGVGLMGVVIAKRLGIPLVQTMHGRDDVFAQTYVLPYLTTLGARAAHGLFIPHTATVRRLDDTPTAHNAWQVMVQQAQAADHVVMPSHHFAQKFSEHGVTKPMDVISNGIGDDVIAGLPQTMRKNDPGKNLHVMWCGRLSDEKRPIDSIEAVAKVPGATLDIYGDGPMEKELRSYIEKRGLSKRMRLKGRVGQSEILSAMRRHDVLLYPSYGFDNQPMVLLEAVAAAIPVVYCDPDLTECMPEKGALITEGISVDAITAALQTVAKSSKQWRRMHTAMFKHRPKVAQSYHSKKMAKLYNQVIRRFHAN